MANSYYIGYIAKAHGYKGGLIIRLEHHISEELSIEEPIFLEINKRLVPFFMEELTQNDDSLLVKLEDIDSDEEVKPYMGTKVHIEGEAGEADASLAMLEGFSVTDTELGKLGTITSFIDDKNNPLLVMDYKGNEVYIPASEDIIVQILPDQQEILVTLPAGLLDIYLDED